MILDLNIHLDRNKATSYFQKLLKDGSKIELRKINPKRSNKQNRYVHCLFTLWGGYYGFTTEESKQVVKVQLNYTYEKDGYVFMQKTSEMDKETLSRFIDKFRNFSAHNGYYLPSPEEFDENYVEMMKEIEKIESQMAYYGT